GLSSRPGTERDALRGRRRSSAGVGKAVAFAALALITTVIGIWQIGGSAAEYEHYQNALPCRTEPVEWGDVSHCHEFRARVTEKIPARHNRGIRQNPRLEIEALDHDQPDKRSFPVTTVFRLVEVGDEILVHGWNAKVVQTRVAEKWWDTPDTPVDDPTREMRAVGLFGAVALITVAFGVLPRLAVRTSAGERMKAGMIPFAITGLGGTLIGPGGWDQYLLICGGIFVVTSAVVAAFFLVLRSQKRGEDGTVRVNDRRAGK